MSIYKDKDQSEIDGILQIFPDAFNMKYGEELDQKALLTYLNNLLAKREQEIFESALGALSPKSIRLLIESVQKSGQVNKVNQFESRENEKSGKLVNKVKQFYKQKD